MCGIYGSTIRYQDQQVREKLKRTGFRGPDKSGFKKFDVGDSHVTLGHNRLAIVDLDPRSNQPFNYQDKVEIVFNGEIYNFKTLRPKLEQLGYAFTTSSDTEVMCAAYLEYGEECLEHFTGMFAFVIYDIEKQKLFGARDRLGKKPFYYYHNGTDFEFSSQISSIQLFNDKLSISKKAILEYLRWGSIPDTNSIFNEVSKLRPGHCFTFDLTNGKLDAEKYWDIDIHQKDKYQGSFEDAVSDLEVILKDAVAIRMFADVPVGVFLSGGVDSSLIAALAMATSNSGVNTFSVKFDEKGFDESVYAQQVADHIKSNHNIIECNYNEGLELIENFSTYFDEPFADSSAIPQMLLSKYTRQKVTVALSGDGGDEFFMGYHRYNWMKKVKPLYAIPGGLRKFSAKILELAPNYRLKTIAKGLQHPSLESLYVAILTDINLNWIDHTWEEAEFEESEYLYHNHKNLYERISDFDIKAYLNWDINTKVDRATMAYSLEARAPIMDHRVVEFANSLPVDYKFDSTDQKKVLKQLLYKYVPKKIFDRPKAGFTMPFQEWFRNDLKEMVLSELNRESLQNIPGIKVDETLAMINEHMEGTWNRYPQIWKLLVLKQWLNNNGKGLVIK